MTKIFFAGITFEDETVAVVVVVVVVTENST
jgi:hypothetical protein